MFLQGNERDAKMQTRVKWLEPSVRRDDWKQKGEEEKNE